VEPKLALFLDYLPQLKTEALSVAPRATLFSDQLHQRRIASGQPWMVFPFTSYGTINYTNCALCPTLASLILQIPSIKLAMLSIMEENTFIPPHCGYFKNVLRCHITLHVDHPETETHKRYISVAGQEHHWTPGDLVVFDDTYPHKVINQVRGRRIVLFLDVERPYTTRVASWLNKAFLTILQKSKTIAQAAKVQEQNALKSQT
jgi:beta-hydroxylase